MGPGGGLYGKVKNKANVEFIRKCFSELYSMTELASFEVALQKFGDKLRSIGESDLWEHLCEVYGGHRGYWSRAHAEAGVPLTNNSIERGNRYCILCYIVLQCLVNSLCCCNDLFVVYLVLHSSWLYCCIAMTSQHVGCN